MTRFLALLLAVAPWLPGCPDGSGLVTTGDDDAADDDAADDDAADDDAADDDSGGGPFGDIAVSLHDEFESLIVVAWDQPEDANVAVEFAFDGQDWDHSPSRPVFAGPAERLVIGVPYATDAVVRLVQDPGGDELVSEAIAITTGDPPAGMPRPKVLSSDPAGWDESMRHVFAAVDDGAWDFGRFYVQIVDRQGRVLWCYATPPQYVSLYPRPAVDGSTLLIDHNTFWTQWDSGAGSEVLRMRLDGTVVEILDTPGLHHPFTELPDGSLVWGAVTYGSNETLEKLTPDGQQSTIFDCQEFHDAIGANQSCVSNTVSWDPATDHFLFSLWTTESVIEIDHASGEAVRWFGQLPGSYAFDPPESQFWWQHGAQLTADGHLLLSTHRTSYGTETVVREYAIDDDAETLHEVWNFGVDDGVYGDQMGEVHRLPGGNTLHNYGTLPRLREATPDGTVVWDLIWDDAGNVGRSTPMGALDPLVP